MSFRARDLPVSEEMHAGLRTFCERLAGALGNRLLSVILFGGVAKGIYDPRVSDVNVMLVLRDISLETLDAIATAAQPSMREMTLRLLTLTEADLADSAEVFPTKFLDVRRHHVVLWGPDLAATIEVPRDRLRRQAVRELVNLHLRLRQFYMENRARPEALEAMLQRSATPLLLNVAVLLELRTGAELTGPEATLAAAKDAGLDAGALARFAELKRESSGAAAAEMPHVYGVFMRQVEAALRLTDDG